MKEAETNVYNNKFCNVNHILLSVFIYILHILLLCNIALARNQYFLHINRIFLDSTLELLLFYDNDMKTSCDTL